MSTNRRKDIRYENYLLLQIPKGQTSLGNTCGRGQPHQFHRQFKYNNNGPHNKKLFFNSTIYTKGDRFLFCDIKKFYLGKPMDRYEYIRLFLKLPPEEIIS